MEEKAIDQITILFPNARVKIQNTEYNLFTEWKCLNCLYLSNEMEKNEYL